MSSSRAQEPRFSFSFALPVLAVLLTVSGATAGVPGDSNCDGAVDFCDVDFLLIAFGGASEADWTQAVIDAGNSPCGYVAANDLNQDGLINFFDLALLLAQIGPHQMVTPDDPFVVTGPENGPFSPFDTLYVIENCGATERSFSVQVFDPLQLFMVNPLTGTIPPGGETALLVRYTANVSGLASDVYQAQMTIETQSTQYPGQIDTSDTRYLYLHVVDERPVEPHCDGRDCGGVTGEIGCEPVQLYSGGFVQQVTDLRIPGRGFDFELTRTYRSRAPGEVSWVGANWRMSYDIELRFATPDLLLRTGDGRTDRFVPTGGGEWGSAEYCRTIVQSGGDYIMTFADGAQWTFATLPGFKPDQHRITQVTDRNGNTMSFEYDGSGRLIAVRDTLHVDGVNERVVQFDYAPGTDFLASVTDWTGRQVRYEYYGAGDPDGNSGDLRAVIHPAVIATPDYPIPVGHEFPDGKTTTYTYTNGFGDPLLDHDLLTITHARANDPNDALYGSGPYVELVYAHTVDPGDPRHTVDPQNVNFDRVVAEICDDGRYDVVYHNGLDPNDAQYNGATASATVNDRNGNVAEWFFDNQNRLVLQREHTGRASDPSGPTDLDPNNATNPPGAALRGDDPPFFETRQEWNDKSLLVRKTTPSGNVTEHEYDDTNPDPRARGCRLLTRRLPGAHTPPGDQTVIEEHYEYGSGFFACFDDDFVTRQTDARGNDTVFDYDANGNLTHIHHRIPTIVEDFEYNGFGQRTARVWPDNGSNHRRRDEFAYYTPADGRQYGYMKQQVVDVGGFELTTTLAYNAVGAIISSTDPRDNTEDFVVNQYHQTIRSISRTVELPPLSGVFVRYAGDRYYDANNNLVRVDIDNITESGAAGPNARLTTLFDFDTLDYLTAVYRETEPVDIALSVRHGGALSPAERAACMVEEYQYDSSRNRTVVRKGAATSGDQPDNLTRTLYDERDLPLRVIRGDGGATPSIKRLDYDGNRNLRRLHNGEGYAGTPRTTDYVYDGYDRLVSQQDAMGNVKTWTYDANSNRTGARIDGALLDVPGDGGNERLYEASYTYDALDREIEANVAFFDTDTQAGVGDGYVTTTTVYNDSSQVSSVTDDNGHTRQNAYDTVGRLAVETDPRGDTHAYQYDSNGNRTRVGSLDRSDEPNTPDESFVTTYSYDGLDRLVNTTDSVGNESTVQYDSRSNTTLTTDALGRVTRFAYDGLDRMVSSVLDMNMNGPSAGDAEDIVTETVWDDSSRVIGRFDDNGNVTRYAYDGLDRLVAVRAPDGALYQLGAGLTAGDWPDGALRPNLGGFTSGYDPLDNVVTTTDPLGTASTNGYDGLDRLVSRSIMPAPNVGGSTAETYSYDGVSRLVSAENDNSRLTRSYDSISNTVRETMNLVPPFDAGDDRSTLVSYDGRSNPVTVVYPGGRTLTRLFDSNDRVTRIDDVTGDPARNIAEFTYIGFDRLQGCRFGNGARMRCDYDGATGVPNPPGDFGVRRLIRTLHESSSGPLIDERTYAWDQVYNKTARTQVAGAGATVECDFTYDDADRLVRTIVTGASGVTRDEQFTLDGVGNRTLVAGGPDAGGYVLDAGAPADAQVNQYTSTSFDTRVYDDNGNLTHATNMTPFTLEDFAACMAGPGAAAPGCSQFDLVPDDAVDLHDFSEYQQLGGSAPGSADFTYDYQNRLVEYLDLGSGQRHEYRYDALGRRVERIVDVDGEAATTRYYYDGWRVIEEQDGQGDPTATYVYGRFLDQVVDMQRDADADDVLEDYYFHADDLHSTVALTNQAGAVVERYDYREFGTPHLLTAGGMAIPESTVGNPYLFTGRRYDPETGLYYSRTRYLDPRAGRFITRDSIGAWGDGMNRGNAFTYVGNNAPTRLDPFGREQSISWVPTKFGHDRIYKQDGKRFREEVRIVGDTVYFHTYEVGGWWKSDRYVKTQTITEDEYFGTGRQPGVYDLRLMLALNLKEFKSLNIPSVYDTLLSVLPEAARVAASYGLEDKANIPIPVDTITAIGGLYSIASALLDPHTAAGMENVRRQLAKLYNPRSGRSYEAGQADVRKSEIDEQMKRFEALRANLEKLQQRASAEAKNTATAQH